jgi:hypothetical protein
MTSFYLTVIHRPEMVPEYLQKEAEEGKPVDLTMSEFADVYRENWPYARPEMTLWKDTCTGPNASSSGSPIRGCGSVWT